MILDVKNNLVRRWGLVGVSALASVVIAAAADPDRNWARIRAMPLEQRTRLLKNLRRFELELTPEKQRAIRELDRHIAELDVAEQSQYFAVLRRYHSWLNGLPENQRDELQSLPLAERMSLLRKLVVAHPVPKEDTPSLLRVAELGEVSPFELASLYRIWQAASPSERERIERIPQAPRRREALLRLGDALKIPRETQPPDFDEARWVATVEGQWRKNQRAFLLEEPARKKADEAARSKVEGRRREVLRRQAINVYLSRREARSVDPQRLAQFVSGLPSWVQPTLDPYPPDEARRRLTFVYRLVFRYPDEIPPAGRGAAPSAPGRSGAHPAPVSPPPEKRKPDVPNSTPF
jgi:hypothetical protein